MDIQDIELQENLLTRFARVVVASGESPSTEYFFLRRLTIGRGDDNTLRIPHPSISTHHAVIERIDDRFRIRDLDSKNGIELNGAKVKEAELHADDRIQLGAALLVFLRYGSAAGGANSERGAQISESRPLEQTASFTSAAELLATGQRTAVDHVVTLVTDVQARLDALQRDAEPEVLARSVLEAVLEVVPAERGVLLLEENGEMFVAGVYRAPGAEDSTAIRVPRSVIDEVLASRAGVLASDIALDERFADKESVLGQGIVSLVATPLITGPLVKGLLYLDSRIGKNLFGGDTLPGLMLVGRAIGTFLGEAGRLKQARNLGGAVASYATLLPDGSAEGIARAALVVSPAPRRIEAAVLRVAVSTAGGVPLEADLYLALVDGFFRRAQQAIRRHGGEVECVAMPVLKALFPVRDAPESQEPPAALAALQIHRECFASNVRAYLTGGIELATRISVEVGELTLGLVGTPPFTHIASVGEPVTRSAELLNQATRGELLIGTRAVERWSTVLRMGRTVSAAARPGESVGGVLGRAVIGPASSSMHQNVPADAPLDVLPVKVHSLNGPARHEGVLTPVAGQAARVVLHASEADPAVFVAGKLLALEVDLYPHQGITSFFARVESVEPRSPGVACMLSLQKAAVQADE